jgi:hypothetical protein
VGGDIAGVWWWPTICWGNGSQVVVLLAPTGAAAPPPHFTPTCNDASKEGEVGGGDCWPIGRVGSGSAVDEVWLRTEPGSFVGL